jgi:hypothetical protein
MNTSGNMSTPPLSGANPEGITGSLQEKLAWFRTNFCPHFDDWIMGPIDRLVYTRDALIGFIFMACAIDYLAGF